MIDKTFVEIGESKIARVTFSVPSGARPETVYLVGDFNNWDTTSHPLRRDIEGKWTITLDLESRRAYQFRYLRESGEWMYDSQADAYVFNPRGVYNFVIITDPDFKRHDTA